MKLIKKTYKFLKSNNTNKSLLINAFFQVFYISIYLRITSNKNMFNRINNKISKIHPVSTQVQSHKIIKIVNIISKYNFIKNTCLTKSIASAILLKKYNNNGKLNLGLRKSVNNQLLAHAWIELNNKNTVSNQDFNNFHTIYSIFY